MFLLALAVAVAEPPSPMEVEIAQDPITDEVRAEAILRADGHRLVVGCDPSRYDGVRVTVHSRRWLQRGDPIHARIMTYRFDDELPRRVTWRVTDRRARLWKANRTEAFIARLATAQRLVVRTDDIEGHRFDMIFRPTEARPALDRMLEACGAAPLAS